MDEKLRILKMVEKGKLSADQAVKLIDAMGENIPADSASYNAGNSGIQSSKLHSENLYENKMLRVIVDSPMGDKVNVQLPVKIIRQLLKVTGEFPIKREELQGIDLQELSASILECLDQEILGNIIEVDDADGGTVKVFIG